MFIRLFASNHLLAFLQDTYTLIMASSIFYFKYGNPYLFPPTNAQLWWKNRYGRTGHARTKRRTVIVSGGVCAVGKFVRATLTDPLNREHKKQASHKFIGLNAQCLAFDV